MGKTEDNLKSAFAGESQANRKYLFFAEKAEEEGYKQVAKLFRAAAEAETVHARNHLRVLKGINSTRENLKSAIEGENHEFTQMYPEFIREAEAEGQDKGKNSFNLANQVEEIHHGLFRSALGAMEQSATEEDKPIYVCRVCGNTVEGEPPETCPICGVPKKMFKLIE